MPFPASGVNIKMHNVSSLPFPLSLSLSLSFLSLLAILEAQKQSGWEARGGSCWNTLEVEATLSQTPDVLLRKGVI